MRHKYLGEIRERAASSAFLRVLGVIAALASVPGMAATGQDTLQVGGQPQVHVVREGETLWALAQMYLGDPFLWPEIYRMNTMVVEDPHWIFPGEELYLAQPDTTLVPVRTPTPGPELEVEPEAVQQTPDAPPVELPEAPPPPPPVEQGGPTVFTPSQPRGPSRMVMSVSDSYRAVRAGDFYAAGFLTENDPLPWADVKGRVGRASSDRIGGPTAFLYGQISVEAPAGATYHVGDSLLTATMGREVPGWGRVVRPTGIARVVHVSGRDVLAEVVALFGRIANNQVAIPVEPFRDPGGARPQSVEDGMAGTVIDQRDQHTVAIQQDVLFIDLGRENGVVAGDMFELLQPTGEQSVADAPRKRLAILQVVHVREHSASGILIQILAPGVGAGTPVRLIGKMPS